MVNFNTNTTALGSPPSSTTHGLPLITRLCSSKHAQEHTIDIEHEATARNEPELWLFASVNIRNVCEVRRTDVWVSSSGLAFDHSQAYLNASPLRCNLSLQLIAYYNLSKAWFRTMISVLV